MGWGFSTDITSAMNGTTITTEAIAISTGGIRFRMVSTGSGTLVIDNVVAYEIGATLALEPEGIQNNLWYDSSSNALNASYPAAGWSLTRKLNVPRTNSGQPAFLGVLASDASNVTGDGTVYGISNFTEVFDNSNSFVPSTGVFTAPVTGRYLFAADIYVYPLLPAHTNIILTLVTSNRAYRTVYLYEAYSASGSHKNMSMAMLMDMDSADTAYLTITASGSTKTVGLYNLTTCFSGHLVC